MIYELLIIVFLLWIIAIGVTKELFSPCAMLCESYIIAILCAIYNIENWQINLHSNTFFIIVLGLLSFFIISLFMSMLKRRNEKLEKIKLEFIAPDKNMINLLSLISFTIFVIYLTCFLKGVGSFSNLEQFSDAMRLYRYKVTALDEESIPTIINFLSKFCRALAYVYSYIIINNLLYIKQNNHKGKDKNFIKYILGIIIYIPMTFMGGGRFDLIVYFLTCIVIWNFLYRKSSGRTLNIKNVFKIVGIFIGIILVFSMSRSLVGRKNESKTLDYVTQYFGGSIHIFDMYMQEDVEFNKVIGQELFSGLRKFLSQIKLLPKAEVSSELGMFRETSDGFVIGNVYTGFRKMHHDFGVIGVVLFQGVLAIIFNSLYYKVVYNRKNNIISKELLVYGVLTYCLMLHSYSEFFFSTIISFNYFFVFVMIFIIRRCLLYYKVKI